MAWKKPGPNVSLRGHMLLSSHVSRGHEERPEKGELRERLGSTTRLQSPGESGRVETGLPSLGCVPLAHLGLLVHYSVLKRFPEDKKGDID